MILPCQQALFQVSEGSQVAAARRAGNELARRLGMSEIRTGEVALVITEAGTNIVKHAGDGQILLRALTSGERRGIEILAIDRGPGIVNLADSMQDGHSTAGSYGVGLGALGRLAAEFDVYSVPEQGTVMVMVLWDGDGSVPPAEWQIGAVCLPLPSEDVSGDSWDVAIDATGLSACVADGLGHGPDAAEASQPAVSVLHDRAGVTPGPLLERAHLALRGTRGAAVAMARIDRTTDQLSFAGVGNIAGCVYYGEAHDASRKHLMSHNGIVGSNLRKVQEFTHPWRPDALLLMHSDGLGTRWDLHAYPGLVFRHPALIAAVLYRDFARQRDDMTVLVIREKHAAA